MKVPPVYYISIWIFSGEGAGQGKFNAREYRTQIKIAPAATVIHKLRFLKISWVKYKYPRDKPEVKMAIMEVSVFNPVSPRAAAIK